MDGMGGLGPLRGSMDGPPAYPGSPGPLRGSTEGPPPPYPGGLGPLRGSMDSTGPAVSSFSMTEPNLLISVETKKMVNKIVS